MTEEREGREGYREVEFRGTEEGGGSVGRSREHTRGGARERELGQEGERTPIRERRGAEGSGARGKVEEGKEEGQEKRGRGKGEGSEGRGRRSMKPRQGEKRA